jgi:TatA/E family protein of Tat protein translocase
MFDLGGGELLLIVLAVLVLFGPKKLPELAQSLGRGMREFKRAQREFTEQINQAVSDESYKKKAAGRELRSPEGAVARPGSSRNTPPVDPIVDATPSDVPPSPASTTAPTEDPTEPAPPASTA